MIRHDIKLKLQNNDLNMIFLKHRDIDRGSYRVAEIDNEIVCWNPDNGEIMDNFFDDIQDSDWFDLKLLYDNMNLVNRFELNRKTGELRKCISNSINDEINYYTKKISYSANGYPYYSIPMSSYEKDKKIQIHRLMALMFIPNINPEEKDCIDHIDRDKNNYSLSNLRWVSNLENSHNKSHRKFVGNNRYEAYTDSEFKNKAFSLTEEELYNSEYKKHNIANTIHLSEKSSKSFKYKGYYWKSVNLDMLNYLRPEETIDDSLWKLHYSGKFYVHPKGLIKNSVGYITLGANDTGYKSYNGLKIHRCVAEVFLNNNQPLDDSLQIDHIDTDKQNNRVENLRICTRLENMHNPLTSDKLKRKVLAEGIIYNSISECAEHYGLTRQAILYRINSEYQTEFSFI